MVLLGLSQSVGFVETGMDNEIDFCFRFPSTLKICCSRWWIKTWLLPFVSISLFFLKFGWSFDFSDCCFVSDNGFAEIPVQFTGFRAVDVNVAFLHFFYFRERPWNSSSVVNKRCVLVDWYHPFTPDIYFNEFAFLWRWLKILVILACFSMLMLLLLSFQLM